MRQIGNFETESPVRLSEQLDRFQANVVSETEQIRLTYLIEPEPVAMNALKTGQVFGVGLLALVDTSLGNVTLALDKPRTPGFAAIGKQYATNSVIVIPAGANGSAPVLINQAASKSYAAIGLYWLFFDGQNWLA